MKTNFSKSVGRLRGKSWAFLLGLVLSVFAAKATDSLYSNSGTINNANLPNVDATNFVNSGTWNISTSAPYETSHTLNYTNKSKGSMSGSVGWEFDYGPLPLGGRGMSANFFNDSSATIQANDGIIYNPVYAGFLGSYLLVSATNIVNKGTLIAGAHGEIVLTGTNVTLSRSDLEITPIQGPGSSNSGTNFLSDVQVYSLFWGTNNMTLTSSNLWNGTNVLMSGTNLSFLVNGNVFDIPSSSNLTNVPPVDNINYFNIAGTYACGSINIPVQLVPFAPAVGSDSMNITAVVTNIVSMDCSSENTHTNTEPVRIIRQAVFLNIEDPNITGAVRFSPSPNPTNAAQTVAVRLTMTSTNVITLSPQTNSIYLVDTLMSQTNSGLNVNTNFDPYYLCSGPVYRPANYIVERTDLGNYFANGSPGGGLPPANFFTTGLTNYVVSNNVVQVNYAGYAAYIDNLANDRQSGGAVTNLGGRIIINAYNLDLSLAGLVAGGYINIQANNLVGSANAAVSCQNLSYNLGSTNGNLNFTKLASLSIPQLQGNIVAWSATWTNGFAVVITNCSPVVTNETVITGGITNSVTVTNMVPTPITNITEIDFYALIVDASSLSSQVPVTVQNLSLHSTNIVISDSMSVPNSFLLDGQTFTLLVGRYLYLYGSDQNWTYANAPNLRYFTNNGYLYIQNDAHFGDDTAAPYAEFVNNGKIYSGDQTIDSLDIQINNGTDQTFVGDFSATARSIEITGSYVDSANDINLSANTLLIDPTDLYANGALNFNVTNSLSDNGAANSFTCYNGFNLWLLPTNGDLLGSTITSIASLDKEEIDHAWAGNDYGTNWAGSNNVVIGTLVLSAQNPNANNSLDEPLFHFYGTGPSSNAMYVGTLDLSQLTANSADVANMIQIDPGMKIYYHAVNVVPNFTLPPGMSPEEFLQAQVPGMYVVLSTNAPVSITVDAQPANRTPISPLIYGVGGTLNFSDLPENASSNQLADLNFTVNRSGGNTETRYNWQLNAHNHAGDWYFESIDDGNATPGATADTFVTTSKNGGAQPMITISMIGWMPILGSGRSTLWSYSVAKYGAQTDNDSHNGIYSHPDAGNGLASPSDLPITWNTRTDANFQTNSLFQQGYVQHLINHWGSSTNGGVRYYCMDNESSYWYGKHWDVHPIGAKMSEIRTNMLTYASMVKSNDPNALVCGPEEWGWLGYIESGYDQQNSGQHDRSANGGWDYIPWLLNQFHQYSVTNTANTNRLLDYVTVHCYPQEDNGNLYDGGDGGDISTAAQLLRNRSTRQFWDTNYVDQSWINGKIMLIPRLKIWVATNYPGTKIGITEYNWGAESYINGAIAQADILGIFGREGVDLAVRWTTPATNTPTYLAMKMYRNYDGHKSTFGDMSIPMAVPNPDVLSAFCAVRTNDDAMTFMVINKDYNATPISLNITNFTVGGNVQRWQLTDANVINQLNITLTNGVLSDIVPARSITLYVCLTGNSLQVGIKNSAGQLTLRLNGQAGQTYIVQSSTNLVTWQTLYTTNPPSLPITLVVTNTGNHMCFYRIKGP
jgi:hypothetical protein